MIGTNRTKITLCTSESEAGFTGSIQRIYAPQGTELDRITFGYHERVGQTGSKAIVTETFNSTLHNGTSIVLEKDATLEGPIINFRISGSATPLVFSYSNNVTI